eukprot:jgi/Botrbrau1/3827/Bobra.0183s0055.2
MVKETGNLTIQVVESVPAYDGLASRLLDNFTPKSKRVAKLPHAERRAAFETACKCIVEAQASKDLIVIQHAQYFVTDGYKPLRHALCLRDELGSGNEHLSCPNEEDSVSTTESSGEAQLTASSKTPPKKIGNLWLSLRSAKLSGSRTPKKLITPEHGGGYIRPGHAEQVDHPGPLDTMESTSGLANLTADKAFSALLLAAPLKGEVQHWVWLLRQFADRCRVDGHHGILLYLGRILKYIAAEEEWLRILVAELKPILSQLHDHDLPSGVLTALNNVAAGAMAVVDESLGSWRTKRSSRLENAGTLQQAVALLQLLAHCGMGPVRQVDALLQEQLCVSAQTRYTYLTRKIGGGRGSASPGHCPISILGLAEAVETLVADVTDDVECYQDSLPYGCAVSLPGISCRAYCRGLRPDLEQLLGSNPPIDSDFFRLFAAVSQLEQLTILWAPSALGAAKAFTDGGGSPIFFKHLEGWMKGVREKLLQWNTRLRTQETWTRAGDAGAICSGSLVEVFRALCTVLEQNQVVLTAQPTYAIMMEASLSKVVLAHVHALEKMCLAELPKPKGGFNGILRISPTRSGTGQEKGLYRPNELVCALLNDLREARNRQNELSGTMRSSVPGAWWGMCTLGKMTLGDHFKMSQGEIERRYASTLHAVVRHMADTLVPVMDTCLLVDDTDRKTCTAVCYPLRSALDEVFESLTPALDVRVLRRTLRETWNYLAGHLHDSLLDSKEGTENALPASLSTFAPRIHRADAILKFLTSYFTGDCNAQTLQVRDEPDKVHKLQRMLALFLHDDAGSSID